MHLSQIDHDRLFKELLETFFTEFIQLFFPAAADAIDMNHIKFLQQELFTDITVGEKHQVDILVETRLKGEPGLILVHVEPQSYIQKNFHERMFIYFSRLYEKYRRRIIPVAVFSYDQVRDESDTFELGFPFLDVLRFHFYKLELKKLKWHDYIQHDNPVAAALLSKMGFKPEEKVRVKLEFMRMLARMKLDPARTELLGGFFETYLQLNREEEERLYIELGKMDKREANIIMEITTSWHEKGRLEGIREGIREGMREGIREGEIKGELRAKQDAICKYMVTRFDQELDSIQKKVQHLNDKDTLDRLLTGLYTAKSIEEAHTLIWDAVGKSI